MSSSAPHEYGWPKADGWVLVAVWASSGDRVPLSMAIGAADYMMRLIISEAELTGGIRRLTALGLLTAEADVLSLTDAGRGLFGATKEGDLFELWEDVVRRLAELAPPDEERGASLSPGAYERGVAEYRRWFAETVRLAEEEP